MGYLLSNGLEDQVRGQEDITQDKERLRNLSHYLEFLIHENENDKIKCVTYRLEKTRCLFLVGAMRVSKT